MTIENVFSPADDGLHLPGQSHYETETFWFSFFVPERRIGGWIYTSVKQNAGVTSGGLWLWDDTSPYPIEVPFYEYFAHLKPPVQRGPEELIFATSTTVRVREPLHSYDITYDDRARLRAELRFDALEPPVALRTGEPPFPAAHHFDQTGHVVGTLTLDGETIPVDCYAMRDRSWGARPERGYRRVGYTWAAGPEISLLTYTAPNGYGPEEIYSGYLRLGDRTSRIVSGTRQVERSDKGWVAGIEVEVTTEDGDQVRGHARAESRLLLSIANHVTVCSLLTWELDGHHVIGEDQDVWSIHEWRGHQGGARTEPFLDRTPQTG